MALNKAMLIGNLGHDPDVKVTPSGAQVATLSVATNEPYKDKEGNKVDHTEWHRVVVWGAAAAACGQYLKKGARVYVEGAIRTRKWKDQNNVERYTTEISATKVDFLDTKSNNGNGQQDSPPAPTQNTTGQPQYGDDDDVPF